MSKCAHSIADTRPILQATSTCTLARGPNKRPPAEENAKHFIVLQSAKLLLTK